MSGFQIERGIPMPERRRNSGKFVNLLDAMEVMDSAVLDNHRQAPSLYHAAKIRGVTISVRKLPDGTTRFWMLGPQQ